MSLNIVLINPEIPQNTGNIARTCAAINATLILIRPLGFSTDEKSVKRAGLDYWDMLNIEYYDSFEEFLSATPDANCYFYTTKSKKNYTAIKYQAPTYLVFGPESKGIDENLLVKNKESCVRIPMVEAARSLNLSNSVAIAAYEVLRQNDFEALSCEGDLHRLKW
ncbi:MAG: tRNA (cytidine(34)-2'-O)-methyltransferase [Spirochaetales bacterium]|nr:tRNA (cytidine(34)-2'-O)-methyltransferase [Spirochaetales bacterium]